jgi:hypothetical protein
MTNDENGTPRSIAIRHSGPKIQAAILFVVQPSWLPQSRSRGTAPQRIFILRGDRRS